MSVTGRCSCRAVTFTVDGPLRAVAICHCSECRRWHGHAGAWTNAPRETITFQEQRGLAWFPTPKGTSKRGFCKECGSSLFYDDGRPKLSICAGALDSPTGLQTGMHLYWGSKGDYEPALNDGLPAHDEYPKKG